MTLDPLGAVLCRLGTWLCGRYCVKPCEHKERRLRKSDGSVVAGLPPDILSAPTKQLRICNLCGRLRIVKPRKQKPTGAANGQ